MDNYVGSSAGSPDRFVNPLLMNIQTSMSEPSGPSGRAQYFDQGAQFVNAAQSFSGTLNQDRYNAENSSTTEARDSDDDPLQWVGANWEEVTRTFPNQWIVIKNGVVAAHSETVVGLREQIAHLSIECPFITKTGSGPIVWRTAYGRY
ncbi:hypothetical protein [Candidatus Binatus sp.]|jgi:hypothetical protein|uniref:hypothetical protein n=1 Tax=Candidatus Binatus sp. TaxID=2811406 RepID=UPI003BDB7EB5